MATEPEGRKGSITLQELKSFPSLWTAEDSWLNTLKTDSQPRKLITRAPHGSEEYTQLEFYVSTTPDYKLVPEEKKLSKIKNSFALKVGAILGLVGMIIAEPQISDFIYDMVHHKPQPVVQSPPSWVNPSMPVDSLLTAMTQSLKSR